MMKLLYEAANSVEAHMIANLLDQAGVSSRIDGEFLQGGAGELQAFGVVRVLVDQADYVEARAIIDTFEQDQPAQSQTGEPRPRVRTSWLAGTVGFLFGVAVTLVIQSL